MATNTPEHPPAGVPEPPRSGASSENTRPLFAGSSVNSLESPVTCPPHEGIRILAQFNFTLLFSRVLDKQGVHIHNTHMPRPAFGGVVAFHDSRLICKAFRQMILASHKALPMLQGQGHLRATPTLQS